jgi:hypothetical protein
MPDMKRSGRGIVTMAFGKQPYIEMAKWLAMSIKLNAPDLESAVLTDSTDPELAELYTHVIPHEPYMGSQMEPKFHLDRFTPFEESFYIDTDCLVLNNLDAMWAAFQGQYFGIPGWRYLTASDVDQAVDVPFVLDRYQLTSLPKFNGGCYYFRSGEETTRFFDTARDLFTRAAELRIGFFRDGGFSDEPLFALALALHGLKLTSLGVRGPWTPLQSRGAIHLDVFAQECSFLKEGITVYPDLVHFPGGYRECYAYHREVWKLQRHFGRPTPPLIARSSTQATGILWSARRGTRNYAKAILRPRERRMAI